MVSSIWLLTCLLTTQLVHQVVPRGLYIDIIVHNGSRHQSTDFDALYLIRKLLMSRFQIKVLDQAYYNVLHCAMLYSKARYTQAMD